MAGLSRLARRASCRHGCWCDHVRNTQDGEHTLGRIRSWATTIKHSLHSVIPSVGLPFLDRCQLVFGRGALEPEGQLNKIMCW